MLKEISYFKKKLKKNTYSLLNKVTHCLIAHQHPNHINNAGVQFLIKNNIPVTCSIKT